IGLGSIGYRHAMNLKKLGHQVYAYDPSITSMGVFNVSSFEEVCEKSEAIVIASPTIYHYNHIQSARLYNKPLFIEKPIADTHAAFAVPVNRGMVGYNLRFH